MEMVMSYVMTHSFQHTDINNITASVGLHNANFWLIFILYVNVAVAQMFNDLRRMMK